jgi:two-component system chemotaxis sensor kinase CheA
MSDIHQESGAAGGDFDLSQFYQIFFEEAGENLDQMEQILLSLNLETADDEELNGVFRCAHSVKGGAATFGFSDVAELTHHMESLLDKLRRHELKATPDMVDVLLESADISRSLLARHQAGGGGDGGPPTTDLVRRISLLASGAGAATAVAPAAVSVPPPMEPVARQDVAAKPSSVGRKLTISIGPLERPEQADAISELFRDIPGLGEISTNSAQNPSMRLYAVTTNSSNEDLLDLFAFHVSREFIKIEEVQLENPVPNVTNSSDAAEGYGFFEGSPGAPSSVTAPVAVSATKSVVVSDSGAAKSASLKPATGMHVAQPEAATIRVAISKVDQLINLVGELVITQAMLAQNSRTLDPAIYQQLLTGLADLDRNTRDLQESVMSIRMIPMSIVFSRFPRMLRDLASKLGK